MPNVNLRTGVQHRLENTGRYIGWRVPYRGSEGQTHYLDLRREDFYRFEGNAPPLSFLQDVHAARTLKDKEAIGQLRADVNQLVDFLSTRSSWRETRPGNRGPILTLKSFFGFDHMRAILIKMGKPGGEILARLQNRDGFAAGLETGDADRVVEFINKEALLPFKITLPSHFTYRNELEFSKHINDPEYLCNPKYGSRNIWLQREQPSGWIGKEKIPILKIYYNGNTNAVDDYSDISSIDEGDALIRLGIIIVGKKEDGKSYESWGAVAPDGEFIPYDKLMNEILI